MENTSAAQQLPYTFYHIANSWYQKFSSLFWTNIWQNAWFHILAIPTTSVHRPTYTRLCIKTGSIILPNLINLFGYNQLFLFIPTLRVFESGWEHEGVAFSLCWNSEKIAHVYVNRGRFATRLFHDILRNILC